MSAKNFLASYICPLNIHFFTQKCPYLVFWHPIFVRFFRWVLQMSVKNIRSNPQMSYSYFFTSYKLSVSSRGIPHLSVSSQTTILNLSVKKVLFPNLRHNMQISLKTKHPYKCPLKHLFASKMPLVPLIDPKFVRFFHKNPPKSPTFVR